MPGLGLFFTEETNHCFSPQTDNEVYIVYGTNHTFITPEISQKCSKYCSKSQVIPVLGADHNSILDTQELSTFLNTVSQVEGYNTPLKEAI